MKQGIRKAALSLLALSLLLLQTGCVWMVYHKPAFEGQVLDEETKEPIEGAVVVAEYKKETFGWPVGSTTSIINIRETLTDKQGRFRIPSYTTLIQPLSWSQRTFFTIYKPGYVGIDYLYDRGLEDIFSGKLVGMHDQEFKWLHNNSLVIRYRSPDIVELPIAKSRYDRINAKPAPIGDNRDWKEQKHLITYIRKEWSFLYSDDPKNLYLPKGGFNE